jgi:SAM-dependent methyltransferase
MPGRIEPEDHFGEEVAARYDEDETGMFEPAMVERVVDLLAELAHGGHVLELGIGTGRIAIPLARRGIVVHGIDLSEAMVARLRAKPGGEQIAVTIGDFATTKVKGSFALAYLVFNTIENLMTQDEQVACFRNVASHLELGGRFVIEVAVPDLRGLPWGQSFLVDAMTEGHLGVDVYDVVNQGLVSHHYYRSSDGRFDAISTPLRYVWPAELDLMARMAGLRLEARWGGWQREPFTSESRSHISVWERPASPGTTTP